MAGCMYGGNYCSILSLYEDLSLSSYMVVITAVCRVRPHSRRKPSLTIVSI